MTKKLLLPEDVRDFLQRRFTNQQRAWLVGEGAWPLSVPLGAPTEKDVVSDPSGVRRWVDAWARWPGPGTVSWVSRQWGRLGMQQLPASVELNTAREIAVALGDTARWDQMVARYHRITSRWPKLVGQPIVGKLFSVMAEYAEVDFERLVIMLDWLERNPASGLTTRELPVEGLDTKWLEKRTGLITDVVRRLRNTGPNCDFYEVCGLRRPPQRVRIRVLCPELRKALGGLRDIEAPLDELAGLSLHPKDFLVLENRETGLALPDMPGVVAVMKLGHAVGMLAALPWLHDCRGFYWGDIDTHGFAILNRARSVFPELTSVLMDAHTMSAYSALKVEEPSQCPETELPFLTPDEREVYEGLRGTRWGQRVRLEQERIPWGVSIQHLERALSL